MAKIYLLVDENSNIVLKPALSDEDQSGMDEGLFNQVFSLESDSPIKVSEVYAELDEDNSQEESPVYVLTETELNLESPSA